MHPLIAKIHIPFFDVYLPIHTYGFFVALGFLSAIFMIKHEARRLDEDPERYMDLFFYILIAAIVSSRLFFVLTNLESYLKHPLAVFKIWEGGLVFYGGFLGAAATGLLLIRHYKVPFFQTFDIAAPGLALGHAIGRLGCFSAGCCYGKPTDLFCAVTFSDPLSLAPTGIPLHPTQLYSAGANFLIFLFLMGFRSKKRFDGQLFFLYVFIYGIVRSIIEIFRGDPRGGFLFGFLSISQFIGILMALTAICFLFYLRKRTVIDVEKKVTKNA